MAYYIALYARVSSERQAQSRTIESQIKALEDKIKEDGNQIFSEYKFIDDGYSGSNLNRPGLEKLRDKISEGEIQKIYVHSPDRLSRKYAYQMVLLDEFKKSGVETIFLNCEHNDTPESQMLLQMQGVIAEYERAKILERNRRGKIFAAKKGDVSVIGAAPYGYRYLSKYKNNTGSSLLVDEEEAIMVREIFFWVGQERLSINAVCQRLNKEYPLTRTGKSFWNRSVIWGILKNPIYKGQAAYGKTKVGARLPSIKQRKNHQSKNNYSIYPVEQENWIYIPVPAIIEEPLFELVQEQLEENRKRYRSSIKNGSQNLLQGLLVCKRCSYAYYGKKRRESSKKNGNKPYSDYRCIGTNSDRYGGEKICNNFPIRNDLLDNAVWEKVKKLLKDPGRLMEEYKRRISGLEQSSMEHDEMLSKEKNRLQKSISRLIDCYTQGDIEKDEFEPRIRSMKQRLSVIEKQMTKNTCNEKLQNELKLIITNLEYFSEQIETKLETISFENKREVIRSLVKCIEIDDQEINIVFRINDFPVPPKGSSIKTSPHCLGLQGWG